MALAAVATASWLTLGLLPAPAAAAQLPTTTLPTIPLPTLPTTTVTLPLPTTTVTLPVPTSSTTATTSATTSSTAPTPTTILPGTTQPIVASTTAVSSSGGVPIPGSTSDPDTSTSVVPPDGAFGSGTTETGEGIGTPDESASNAPLWSAALRFLRPVLPPRIAEVLLSPLLILEVVIRALLDSGTALPDPRGRFGYFHGLGVLAMGTQSRLPWLGSSTRLFGWMGSTRRRRCPATDDATVMSMTKGEHR